MNKTEIHEKCVKNFLKDKGQFQVVSEKRVWAKLDAEEIYRLLQSASGIANKRSAKLLVRDMASHHWTIKSTAKAGGFDPNAPLHITIKVPLNSTKPAFHLNCREIPGRGLVIYEITQKRLENNAE